MQKKILGVIVGIAMIMVILSLILILPNPEITIQKHNEKIGLVINTPNSSISLQDLDQIYSEASTTGIGRSNVYLFWNIIEPKKGEFNWEQSDVLMSLNKKNNLKVTLFFSVINGETLGPFPDWVGKPSINAIDKDQLVHVLDAIISRYNIIDTVIIAGETESQFRNSEQNIPVYNQLFDDVYAKLKEKHSEVKIGNAFALHNIINKNLNHIVDELSQGDFVAFSYFPVDSLNEIDKSPQEAKTDLQQMFQIVPDKKIGLFEISWSTSDFIGGNNTSQKTFLEKSFEFFTENQSEIEFFTWYRQNDRVDQTCVSSIAQIGNTSINIGGGSALGSSEHVIERLSHYVCNSGLIDDKGNPKPSWNEFKHQIDLIK